MVDKHRGQAFVRRNSVERYSFGRAKTCCPAVTELLAPLHIPVHLVLGDSKVMLQDPSRPQRGRLLILPNPYSLSDNIAWFFDSRGRMIGELGMHEESRRKH